MMTKYTEIVKNPLELAVSMAVDTIFKIHEEFDERLCSQEVDDLKDCIEVIGWVEHIERKEKEHDMKVETHELELKHFGAKM